MRIYTQGLWQHSHSLGAWADNGQSYHSMKGCPASRWLALVCQDASAWVLLSWILLTLESSLGHTYLMATCLRFSLQEDRVNRGWAHPFILYFATQNRVVSTLPISLSCGHPDLVPSSHKQSYDGSHYRRDFTELYLAKTQECWKTLREKAMPIAGAMFLL